MKINIWLACLLSLFCFQCSGIFLYAMFTTCNQYFFGFNLGFFVFSLCSGFSTYKNQIHDR